MVTKQQKAALVARGQQKISHLSGLIQLFQFSLLLVGRHGSDSDGSHRFCEYGKNKNTPNRNAPDANSRTATQSDCRGEHEIKS